MPKVCVVGIGKMGVSHLSILGAQRGVEISVCDSNRVLLEGVKKYTKAKVFSNYDAMLADDAPDAIVVATPSRLHAPMVRKALDAGVHVFCEKPFCLDWRDSDALANLASEKALIGQVGYHFRYVGAFQEMKRVVESGALGQVTHVLAEAYGPVVLRPQGTTWRTKSNEGGGSLYDYAAHPINLVNWCFGEPSGVSGTILNRVFSAETDDEVYATMSYDSGMSVHVSVNWSDESFRKMSTKISMIGTNGRLTADRQEMQLYLRQPNPALPGYVQGWNVKYTTELTEPVGFYLRGEEYSAQLEEFVGAVAKDRPASGINDFVSAAETDKTIAMLLADRDSAPTRSRAEPVVVKRKRRLFGLG